MGGPLVALLCLSVPLPSLPWGRRFCLLKTGFWPLAVLGFGSPENRFGEKRHLNAATRSEVTQTVRRLRLGSAPQEVRQELQEELVWKKSTKEGNETEVSRVCSA